MTIQSKGELAIVLQGIVMQADRFLDSAPRNAALQGARKSLGALNELVTRGQKPTLLQIQSIQTAADAIRGFSNDEEISDRLFDVQDYFAANK